ncbi:hypothetical protein ABZ657_08405, partial [Streptomyces sp. NPDC007000]
MPPPGAAAGADPVVGAAWGRVVVLSGCTGAGATDFVRDVSALGVGEDFGSRDASGEAEAEDGAEAEDEGEGEAEVEDFGDEGSGAVAFGAPSEADCTLSASPSGVRRAHPDIAPPVTSSAATTAVMFRLRRLRARLCARLPAGPPVRRSAPR